MFRIVLPILFHLRIKSVISSINITFVDYGTLEGYATGSLLFAYGITRLAGSNNQKFKDDIVGTFVLPEVDVANSMNDYSKGRNK